MNKPFALIFTALLAVSGAVHAQDKPPASPQTTGIRPKLEALQDKASYIIGFNLGKSLKTQHIPVTPDLIIQGLQDGLGGSEGLLTQEEIQGAMQQFQAQIASEQQGRRKAEGEKNLKESQAFLDQNKTRKEVKTTASGLQYEVIKEGSGESPKPTDQVTVNYKGTLPDGTVFDSSYERNEPVTFPCNGVIPGWVEALQLMKPGAKYKLYLPSALAYGEQGAGDKIGPNQALVFEVELISVTHPPPAEAPAEPEAQPEKPPAR
jgi:FKBP-type peptidyl-prolyl cis-trans isomerase FklB